MPDASADRQVGLARGHCRAATLRPRRLAVPRFRGFPAYCGAVSPKPSRLADNLTLPYREGPLCSTAKPAADVRFGSFASDMIVRIQWGVSASPRKRTNAQTPH